MELDAVRGALNGLKLTSGVKKAAGRFNYGDAKTKK